MNYIENEKEIFADAEISALDSIEMKAFKLLNVADDYLIEISKLHKHIKGLKYEYKAMLNYNILLEKELKEYKQEYGDDDIESIKNLSDHQLDALIVAMKMVTKPFWDKE